jgi:2-hydroxymuconate-semialdehyde hydrolase
MPTKHTSFENHRVAYWEAGSGPPLLLLHGVGPGTSMAGNFGPALEPLAERFHIFGPDLIGFGDSERRSEPPYFEVDLWVRQGLAMLDLMPPGPVGLLGHSLGGVLAIKIAARTDRVSKVLTSSTIGAPFALTGALDQFWTIPADRPALVSAMRNMVHDTAALTDAMIDMRWNLLTQPGYADYFVDMFAGDRQALLDQAILSNDDVAHFKAALMMLHGFDDQGCPVEKTTVPVAARLGADALLLSRCGHNLPRERTQDYLAAIYRFFQS